MAIGRAAVGAASTRLDGLRCLRCVGRAVACGDEAVCSSCGASFALAEGRVIAAGDIDRPFVHGLDAEIDSLIGALDRLDAPTCTEHVIAAHARTLGVDIGNPAWEGRADVARLVSGADGVAVDVGAGFGTISVALARSAAHVFALEKSSGRARATAARARAEGLRNVTPVHADGSKLPLGTSTCDLALLVGVLEWTGLDQDDPVASQELVLAEVARVLKPGGTLLIGIENRFGAHYLLGFREEHTKLRFASLLPRVLADVYCRAVQGRKLTTYTHSRRALHELVRRAGLEPRVGVALPTYSEPQISFDEEDFDEAWAFYLHHIYRYSTLARRALGAVGRRLPARWFTFVVPTFWLVARKGVQPERLPTVVTGSADCAADVKVIDWRDRELVRFTRRTGQRRERVPLVDGWTARSWISSPLSPRERLRRLRTLVEQATVLLALRERQPIADGVRSASLEAALAGLERVDGAIGTATRRWCRDRLRYLSSVDLEMVEEHADFATVNLVVEAPTLELRGIDRYSGGSFGPPGIDGLVLTTDVLCVTAAAKDRDLDLALTRMLTAHPQLSNAFGRLLWTDFGADASIDAAVALTVAAVLRYSINDGRARGLGPFLNRAASGELAAALRRLRSV